MQNKFLMKTVRKSARRAEVAEEINYTQELLVGKQVVDELEGDTLILHDMECMDRTINELEAEVQLTRRQYEDEQAFAQRVEGRLKGKTLQLEAECAEHRRTEYKLKVMTSMRDALHVRLEKMDEYRDNILESSNSQFDLLQKIQDAVRPYMNIHDFHGGPGDLANRVQEILDEQQGLS